MRSNWPISNQAKGLVSGAVVLPAPFFPGPPSPNCNAGLPCKAAQPGAESRPAAVGAADRSGTGCGDLCLTSNALGVAALKICHDLLRPGGYLAFTDAVWREENPHAEVRAGFELDYPAMGNADQIITTILTTGFELIDHFTLPDQAWWEDFYTPMEDRIKELRHIYRDDPETLTMLDQIGEEPAQHRRHSRFYAYEFFVVRRPGTTDLSALGRADQTG